MAAQAEAYLVRVAPDGQARYALMEDDSLLELVGSPFDDRLKPGDRLGSVDEHRLLAPCEPSKVILVGRNYEGAEESSAKDPQLFLKPPTAICGPLDPVVLPADASEVTIEIELTVVIRSRARNLPVEAADDHILGYTCGNDITARGYLKGEGADWIPTRAKGTDTFCPLGPAIAVGLDPTNLRMEARVNGEVRQEGSTSKLIASPQELLSFASSFMTLFPGDVILTSTPPLGGTIGPGDFLELEIEGIGMLANPVVAADQAQ